MDTGIATLTSMLPRRSVYVGVACLPNASLCVDHVVRGRQSHCQQAPTVGLPARQKSEERHLLIWSLRRD
jgi:hypothetical protein